VDEKVLEAQKWVNSTYGSVAGYQRCPEDGRTGWSVMYSFTRGLQIELGITSLSDSFGPTTLSKLAALGDIGPAFANKNIVNIIKHALFCKGYWGGAPDGNYDADVIAAVRAIKRNAGLDDSDFRMQPKLFKSLLTMDAYVLLAGGSEQVRAIQQWLNGRYLGKSTFFVIPCDGFYSRDVQQALMKALQYESGIPADQATGNFGPGTKQSLRDHPVAEGSSGVFVQLFSAACVFNGVVQNTVTSFKSTFDSLLRQYVEVFQKFSALPTTGRGDYATWCQLLVSSGDPDRLASACDTRFHITPARARALYAADYRMIGRYLDEDPWSTIDKEIQPGELDAIFDGGLRVFPISQYDGGRVANFTYSQGYQHALRAHARAVGYGFNRGTVIYFAVDYDATDDDITSNIIPYFNGIQAGLASQGKRYIAAVYGSRNVCRRVTSEANARYSFVSGMSWGFSGNLGFPMPANWSFTQIKEFTFSAGGDSFGLDNDVHRPGSDRAVGRDGIGSSNSPVDAYLAYIDTVYQAAVAYNKGNPSLRVLEYLRYPNYVDVYDGWGILIGDVDRDWIAYVSDRVSKKVASYPDPSYGVTVNADHFGATANAVYLMGYGSSAARGWRGDFGGWGGDLSTFWAEWYVNRDQYPSGYDFCTARLAKIDVSSTFSFGDLIEDVDGFLVGMAVRDGGRITDVLRDHLAGNGHLSRFRRFWDRRYGSAAAATEAARNMLEQRTGDDTLGLLTAAAMRQIVGPWANLPGALGSPDDGPLIKGYVDKLQTLVGQENARIARLQAAGKVT
jgi:peptidoglycan hydrolase-like protein with peptidoglycan-binding domain